MVTEIDLLREDIPRLEKKFGKENAFVELLKAQLAFLQNQTAYQPQREQKHQGHLNFNISNSEKK